MSLFNALPVIALVLVQLAVWTYALVMRHIALRLRELHRMDAPLGFAGRVTTSGIVGLALGAICILIVSDPGIARGMGVPFALTALGMIGGGVAQLWGASVVRASARGGPNDADGIARGLTIFAFLILMAPFTLGLFLSYFVLLIPIGIAVAMYVAGKRRLDQGAVLWSLAFGSEPGRSMARELQELAPRLSAIQRWRTIRLSQLVSDGTPVDAAIRMVPGVVPHAAALEIQVGAQNGRLDSTLKQSAIRHGKRPGYSSLGIGSTSSVLMYLLVVPLVTVLIVFGLMTWIIPKFKAIFNAFNTDLPEATKRLIGVSDTMAGSVGGSLVLIGCLVALGYLTYAYCRGWGENNLPLFGRLLRRLDVPGILRNLAATYAADRPLESALSVLSRNHRRTSVARALQAADAKCRNGVDTWQALVQVGLLKRSEADVLTSAVRAGNLWWALQHLADGIERRQSLRARAVLEIVQPLIVVAIGAVVAWISIAMFTPMLKLINDLS